MKRIINVVVAIDRATSIQIQERAFELGYRYSYNKDKIIRECRVIYLSDDMKLSFSETIDGLIHEINSQDDEYDEMLVQINLDKFLGNEFYKTRKDSILTCTNDIL